MTDVSFRPHIVAKASSAAEGLCKWVRAMVSYDDVAKVVAPKKEKLFAAQKECDEAETFLNEKRKTLSALNAKLAALNKNLQETLQEKLKLEKEVESCTSKLKKAENLIASLGGEKDRWMQCAKNLQVNYDNLVGDMILSCGIIAYMAPYGFAFRNKILEDWKQYINDLKIPYTKNYTFVNMFGEENDITYWYFCGLPKNCFSTENAIIMKNSNLWCLFIDSQNQANQWIKQIEKKNGLKVVKLTDPNYMPIIQYNVENGIPILIENVKEQLDIQLDPFLMQTIYKDDNTCYLDTGRDSIRYSDDFRLYITTRLLNPQYSYETFSKLTIIDFSIPNEALQDKLLDIIISREKPEHQERFEVLLRQDAANKKILKQQEDNILSTLSSAATNILEDESAIQILDSSKNLSLNVMKKQEAAKSMALEINKFRDTYIQFVKHCASLFSTLNALSYLNHMYCFSFSWFIQLYIRSIETSNRSIVLEKRLGFLKSSFIENLHSSVCRSLSEKHTILYSFLLCSNIMLDNQEATEEELKVFMSLNLCHVDSVSNCAPNWLPYDVWNGIYTINSKFLAFHGLVDDFLHNTDLWKQYYNSEPLQSHLMPKPWINKLSSFQKLILLKILRPDKVIIEIIKLIESTMGNLQNYSPRYKISQSFVESSCLTPLVFILPSCSPPLSLISTFASAKGYSSKFTCLSMGYGQESKAEFLIQEAQKEGGWVFLQNCHLATHWMVQLEKICENCQDSNVSLDFRLWLSSYPTDEFPISILQNSIKITNDYPLNFKQNLLNIYQSEPIANKEFFDGCPGKDKIFSKLLFGLCLFHIATKERSHFGIQSWNIPYDFDHSDFQLSITQLQDTINNTSYVPFDILLYTIGECHYGGKIIDHYDLRCLRYLLEHYFNKDIIKDERYTASNTIRQLIPQRCEYLHVIKHIMEMPLNVPPQVYGCNENGVITRDSTIAAQFLSSVSDMNSVTQSPNENCIQDQVLALINDIYKKLPKLLEIDELKDRVSVPVEPLDRVLLYESRLFNHALNIIIDTLNNLKLAFDGYITLSDSLKKSSKRIYNNQVPHNWKELQNGIVINNLSYYIDNLSNREDFLTNWIIKKSSNIIRLDALFSSKMFLSSVLLTFSKQHVIPVEEIVYDFKVSTIKESSEVNDTEIYFIHGLYLAGAQWNCEKNILKESFANVFWQEMPPIRFKCVQNNEHADESYECPLYITAIRHKNNNIVTNMNNYITRVPLKTDVHYSHWIKCGTALFSHVPR